jgi:predicted RecB family nuclease
MTPTDLANYVRCPHRVFLDQNGDPAERLPPSAFAELLWAGGRKHEDLIVSGLNLESVDHDRPLPERLEATEELMARGVAAIYHAALAVNDMVGEPDLLLRSNTLVSRFGAYGYIPADVKSGNAFTDANNTKPKPAYAVQLCAYAELLEFTQGVRPPIGQIIDKDGAWQTYDLNAFWPEYERIKAECEAVLGGEQESRPGWQSACASCGWQKHCWKELVSTDDLTTVDGVGASYRDRLWQIGVKTASDLAAADPAALVGVKGIKLARAEMWTRKARVQKDGHPLFLAPWTPTVVDFEVSYDIEDFSIDPFVYLHGLLIRPQAALPFGTAVFTDSDYGSFEPVCATAPESEEEVWRAFLAKIDEIDGRGTYVVYVYSHHEKSTLRRLAARYGGSDALERFVRAFIDLERVMKRAVVMPTDSSSLKAFARYAGFAWRDEDPGGAQSLAWWNDYWTDPVSNGALRERVLRYNEDDVRASFVVKDWLIAFCARRMSESSML